MYRIGMIGSENSHATAFSRIANLPDGDGNYLFPDVRVTHILGDTYEGATDIAKKCGIEHVVRDASELYDQVDAVMIVYRHGKRHYPAARPFVERKIPVWVDKPVTIDSEECMDLIRLARKNNTILAGGSTCKYCPDVLGLKSEVIRLDKESKVISGALNFPGKIDSPYGGIYFYGGHAAEMLTTIFGRQIRSIKADVHCGNVVALVKYDTFTVTINFSDVSKYYGTIYSPKEVVQAPIDISNIYYHGFSKYVDALRQGSIVEPLESLLFPVLLLNTLEEAINKGEAAFPWEKLEEFTHEHVMNQGA